jgi:hypothetical protein
VFAGVGERTREGNNLYREMIESGVIKLGDKQVRYIRDLLGTGLVNVCKMYGVLSFCSAT